MSKVLHLITGLGSGGAERMLTRLVTNPLTVDSGLSHVVVSMMDEGVFGRRLQEQGVRLHCLRMRPGRPSLTGAIRLYRLLRTEKPQVVQTWLYHADILGTLMGALAMVPCTVWNIRCSDMELQNRSRTLRAILKVLALVSPRIDAVVVNSNAGREAHERLNYRPPRWQLISNGFDLDKLRPDASRRADSRRLMNVGDNTVVVGMVARVDPQKDHRNLFAAAAEVLTRNPGTIFALVGKGCEEQGPLRELSRQYGIDSRICLLGEREDVSGILPGFDLFVLSSAYGEGFPNVIAEAMAVGVPVVATDVGDSRLIVGDSGIIVSPRAPLELASALNQMIECDASTRQKFGDAARARIAECYSLDEVCTSYDEFYRSLVSKSVDTLPQR